MQQMIRQAVTAAISTLAVSVTSAAATSQPPVLLREFHANNDAHVDALWLHVSTDGSRTLRVVAGGSGAELYTVSGGGYLGFDVQVVTQLIGGQPQRRLIVSDPQAQTGSLLHGSVRVLDAATGQPIYTFTPPAPPPESRAGLRVKAVSDLNADGVFDLVIEGAVLTTEGWVPQSLLVSGSDGAMMRAFDAPFDQVKAFIDAGGRLTSPSDVDGNGRVDLADLLAVSPILGSSVTPGTQGDHDFDGVLTSSDLIAVLNDYLSSATTFDAVNVSDDMAGWLQIWAQAYEGRDGFPALPGGSGGDPGPGGIVFDGNGAFQIGDFGEVEGQLNSIPGGGGGGSGPPGGWPNPMDCGPGATSCGGGGVGSSVGPGGINRTPRCDLTLEGCPNGTVQVDERFSITASGRVFDSGGTPCVTEFSTNGNDWSEIPPEGVLGFDPETGEYWLKQPACIAIRVRCEVSGSDPVNGPYSCCACEQCIICTPPAAEPECPAFVDIRNCRTYDNWFIDDDDETECVLHVLGCDTYEITVHYGPDQPDGDFHFGFSAAFESLLVAPVQVVDIPLGNGNRLCTITFQVLPDADASIDFAATYCLTETPLECECPTSCCEDTDYATLIIHPDSDCDDLTDSDESPEPEGYGTDPNDPDSDEDGYCDGYEVRRISQGFDPNDWLLPGNLFLNRDTDRDGLTDARESSIGWRHIPGQFGMILDPSSRGPEPDMFDTDRDGLQDSAEVELGFDPASVYLPPSPNWSVPLWPGLTRESDNLRPEALARDLDRDFIDDGYELSIGLDPTNPDMDGDGIRDGLELRAGTNPLVNHRLESPDTDGDGLCDYEERFIYGTDPDHIDSDRDGLTDGFEARAGLDPRSAYTHSVRVRSQSGFTIYSARIPDGYTDTDLDGLDNFHEQFIGTDPSNSDSDGDDVSDGDEMHNGADPNDGSDDGQRNEGVCWVMITINGGHHDTGCAPVADDDDPGPGLGVGIGGMTDEKLVNNWTVTIDGGDGEGGGSWSIPTGPNGGRTTLLRPLHRGRCYDITVGGNRRPGWDHDAGYLQIVPVNMALLDENGRPQICTTCCCWHVDNSGEALGNYCCLNSSCNTHTRTARICLPLVDIDVDSDNNDKLQPPQESRREDNLEEEIPGKVIAVRDDDSDQDGIPDWADGFLFTTQSLGLGEADNPDQIAEPGDQLFVPVVVKYEVDATVENLVVSFGYPASDPALVTTQLINETVFAGDVGESRSRRVFNLPGDGPGETPAPGERFRLWTKNGSHRRDARSVANEGDFIPNATALEVTTLDPSGSGRFVIYLEAVRPTTGDTPDLITVNFSGVGDDDDLEPCPDSITVSATLIRYVEVRPSANGTHYRTVSRPSTGLPAPTATMDWYPNDVRFNNNYTGIIADLFVESTVTDFASDQIPTAEGVIESAPLILNGDYLRATPTSPAQSISYAVSKTLERSSDPVHPYPFLGETDDWQAFEAVPVLPGWNHLKIAPRNYHGFAGFAEKAVSIDVEIPTVSISFSLDIGTHSLFKPSSGATGTFTAVVTTTFADGTSEPPLNYSTQVAHRFASLSPPQPGGWYAQGLPQGDFEILAFDDEEDDFGVAWFYPRGRSAPIAGIPIRLTPPANAGDPWTGTGVLEDYEQEDYVFSRVSVGEHGDPRAYDGADNVGFMIEYVGPNYLKRPEDAISVLGRDYKYIDYAIAGQSRTFVMNEEIAALPNPVQRTPTVFIGMPNLSKVANDPLLSVQDYYEKLFTSDYMIGYAVGLWKGGVVSIFDGIVDIYDGAVNASAWFIDHSLAGVVLKRLEGVELVDIVEDERKYWEGKFDDAGRLAVLMAKLKANDALVVTAILTGDTSMLDDDLRIIVETVRTIADAAIGYIDNVSPRELGELHGNITGQVAQIVVFELVTAGGATPALLQKSTLLTKFLTKLDEPVELAPKLARFNELLAGQRAAFVAHLTTGVQKILTTRMCFVAGTLVHTSCGVVPIEQVTVGDQMIARHEFNDVVGHFPVVATIKTYPTEVYTIEWELEDCSVDSVTGTAEHPFWVNGCDAFVPLRSIAVGDELTLVGDRRARVVSVGVAPGELAQSQATRLITYNLEVDQAHTYYVGASGALVHNASAFCEKLFSAWKWFGDTYTSEPIQARWYRLEKVASNWISNGRFPDSEKIDHLGDALAEILENEDLFNGRTVDDLWTGGPFSKKIDPATMQEVDDLAGAAKNIVRHGIDHVEDNYMNYPGGEFPGLHGSLDYLMSARAFVDAFPFDGVRYIKWSKNGQTYFLDRLERLVAVTVDKPPLAVGPCKTFHRRLPTKSLHGWAQGNGCPANLLSQLQGY